jgi:hypothetical protein
MRRPLKMPIDLDELRTNINSWCQDNGMECYMLPDIVGMLGVKIYDNDKNQLNDLIQHIESTTPIEKTNITSQKVRGGVILAVSTQALSEAQLLNYCRSIGEIIMPNELQDKLNIAFSASKRNLVPAKEIPHSLTIEDSAIKIVEDQYKDAISGITRSNQSSRQRNLHSVQSTYGGVLPSRTHRLQKKKREEPSSNRLHKHLKEAFEGMAAPEQGGPTELFSKFGQALTQLGNSLGIGPLQNMLEQRGIQYRKAKDGQSIILYVMNSQTNAPQPIARITASTLSKPHDFEEQLLNVLDFAKGDAPGSFKQQQETLRDQEKAVRDITKALNLQPELTALAQQSAGKEAPTAAASQAASIK